MNRFLYHSGITCYPYPDSSSVTCLLSYSSITDNIACGVSCICLHQSGAKHEIKCCNILRNMQGTPTQKEQFVHTDTWWSRILAFLRTMQLTLSMYYPLPQSLSRTAQLIIQQATGILRYKTQLWKVLFTDWTIYTLEIATLNMTL